MADDYSGMRLKKIFLYLALFSFYLMFMSPPVYAGFTSGLARTLLAPLEIPKAMLQGGLNPVSIVGGVLSGTTRAVTGVVGGLGEMAQGTASTATQAAQVAAPYAKYAPLFFL